jgi:hypothetical protein
MRGHYPNNDRFATAVKALELTLWSFSRKVGTLHLSCASTEVSLQLDSFAKKRD